MLRQLSRPLNSSETSIKPKTPSTHFPPKPSSFNPPSSHPPLHPSTSSWLTTSLTKTFSSPQILNFCDTSNETSIRKQHKNFLIDNIKTINKRLRHCNSMITKHNECNKKTAEENLQLEFKQDSILHERIHMNGVIPRLRIQVNDMRDQLLRLEKETKQYEILKYHFIQEKLHMENELKRCMHKVKEASAIRNELKYKVKNYKRKIEEMKGMVVRKEKDDSFLKDISKLMKL